MTFSAPRRALALTPLALAISVFSSSAIAQDMPVVAIQGARFAADPSMRPIGATVFTAQDIRDAGVNDVNEAIRKIGGVYARQALDGSKDFGLDLRGFGANSSQNVVVVLDGVRLSENELGSAVLSSIPIDTVERIEIIRGGASVLYGDGATGGVIQIVTKRPGKQSQRGSVRAELGQFNARDLRGAFALTGEGFAFDAAVGHQATDNYRANNDYKQNNFSLGAQWTMPGGRFGLRADGVRSDARFPGSLTLAVWEATPRKAATPNDFGSLDYTRLTAFAEQRVGAFDLAAELSHREKTVKATYVSSFGTTKIGYEGDQTQFSPRLRHLAQFDGMLNEFVSGVDMIRWSRLTDSSFSKADASQKSTAIYARDEIKWDAAHNGRLAIGARHETFDKDSRDPVPYTTATYSSSQSQNAWEIQGSYDFVWAKAGQSYRVANADENGYTPVPNKALKGQTSRDLEVGVSFADQVHSVTARAFRHNLTNEIFYDPTAGSFGANTNLDPTQRQGFEVDATAVLHKQWRLAGHYQHVAAEFRAGKNAGREMVLVPANTLSARLTWLGGVQTADLGLQWVDEQRYGGDFANSCAGRIPAFTTLDARYAHKLGSWELAVAGTNLTDKQYFSNAFGCKSGIYSSDGRQLKISARYDF